MFLNNKVEIKTTYCLMLISTFCFVGIAYVSIMIWKSPASGYEASIYKAIPKLFWGVILINILWGIITLIYELVGEKYKTRSFYVVGILLMVLPYILILSLYIIRGYPLYGSGDVMSHYDYVRNISLTGHLDKQNIYPISHILAVKYHQILGIDIMSLFRYIPLIFNILYLVFIILLARIILPYKEQLLLAVAASATIVYNGWSIYFAPNQLANLFLPLAFYLFFRKNLWVVIPIKKNSFNYAFLLCIVLILYPVFHQVSALGLFLLIPMICLPANLLTKLKNEFPNNSNNSFMLPKLDVVAIIIMFVWLISWVSSFYVWKATIRNIYSIITEESPMYLDKFTQDALYAQQHGYNIISLFFKNYGGALLYVILALLAFPILRRKIINEPKMLYLFSLYGPIPAYALAIIALFLVDLPATPLRVVSFVVLIATLFTGYMLSEIVIKAKKYYYTGKKGLYILSCSLVVLILYGSYINGILKLYPSPYTLYPNDQVTRADLTGMNWFFNKKDTSFLASSLSITQGRFSDLLLTPAERRMRKDLLSAFASTPPELKLPFHFGYDKNQKLGVSYKNDAYLILNKRDEVLYGEVFPDMAHIRFTPSDFRELENDISLNRLYENGEFTVRYIRGMRGDRS